MRIRKTLLTKHPEYTFAALPESLSAQGEVLWMVIDWLIRRYPERFRVSGAYVKTLDPGYQECFRIADFEEDPLRLASLLIQEDLFILSEQEAEESQEVPDQQPTGKKHVLVAGSSCFSFDIPAKLGCDMDQIHHPYVPGFQRHLQRPMNRAFGSMKPGDVWWRHNWQVTDYDDAVHHDVPFAHVVLPTLHDAPPVSEADLIDAEAAHDRLHWRAEFQTLQRLHQHPQCLLFTVRTYVDPFRGLARSGSIYPQAAAAAAAAVRRKYKGMFHYMGIGAAGSQKAILSYLDGVARRDCLVPGVTTGLPEPWERRALEDGTFAAGVEQEMRNKNSAVARRVKHVSKSKL